MFQVLRRQSPFHLLLLLLLLRLLDWLAACNGFSTSCFLASTTRLQCSLLLLEVLCQLLLVFLAEQMQVVLHRPPFERGCVQREQIVQHVEIADFSPRYSNCLLPLLFGICDHSSLIL